MIGRIWYGWVKPELADTYEEFLKTEVFPDVRRIEGCKGIYLMRRPEDGEVAIVEISLWESMEAVEVFAGKDHTKAVVSQESQKFLTRWNDRSTHFEVVSSP
jgi:heme-degrading monooxygenase HmoA